MLDAQARLFRLRAVEKRLKTAGDTVRALQEEHDQLVSEELEALVRNHGSCGMDWQRHKTIDVVAFRYEYFPSLEARFTYEGDTYGVVQTDWGGDFRAWHARSVARFPYAEEGD